ncbi:MAG: TetR family transcriptional regulator [Solirubrobacterales bacterium]|nr:TetR family transcriptional regulator [Solirubrobacterales bacterium]
MAEAVESGARRGEATRQAIELAAIDLFAELGYNATSMRQIAASAGIRPAAIYHWFPSKEAILTQLQDDFMDRLEEAVDAAVAGESTPAGELAAAVREHVVFHGLHPRAAFVTDSEIRALSPEPKARLIARRDEYEGMFRQMIERGVEAGEFEVSNPAVASYAILLQCTGVALWYDPAGELPLEVIARIHVELVLASLGARRNGTGERELKN